MPKMQGKTAEPDSWVGLCVPEAKALSTHTSPYPCRDSSPPGPRGAVGPLSGPATDRQPNDPCLGEEPHTRSPCFCHLLVIVI